MKNFKDFLRSKEFWLAAFIFLVVICAIAWFFYNKKKNIEETFDSPTLNSHIKQTPDMYQDPSPELTDSPIPPPPTDQMLTEPVASEQIGTNEVFKTLDPEENTNMIPNDCYPKQKMLTAEELLPSECDNTWAQSNPVVPGSVNNQNFLNAGYHIGLNTVGQSLRNANMQLRSEPPNPQVKVCPWNQSTIEADIGRKGLEIGTGC